MTRPSSAVANIVVLLVAGLALVVAIPWSRAVFLAWMPAADFAVGVAMVTLSFVQVGRAASAWLARSASLAWLGAALTMSLGLFVAGSAQMLDAQRPDLNWLALGGIIVALVGVQWQRRCALR